jgi:hypothetical protein
MVFNGFIDGGNRTTRRNQRPAVNTITLPIDFMKMKHDLFWTNPQREIVAH